MVGLFRDFFRTLKKRANKMDATPMAFDRKDPGFRDIVATVTKKKIIDFAFLNIWVWARLLFFSARIDFFSKMRET